MNKTLDSFVIFKAKRVIIDDYWISWEGLCPWCIKETVFLVRDATVNCPSIQCDNCKESVNIINEDNTGNNVGVEKCK